MKFKINNNWYFTKNYSDALFELDSKDKLSKSELVEEVRIPHTLKEMELNYCDDIDYQMLSAYIKIFRAENTWLGKRVFVEFEACGHQADIYVNRKYIGRHSCGYTAFSFDISAYLEYGAENQILVKLDSRESLNIPPFGGAIDYMTFGGIYREVSLHIREEAGFKDVFVYGDMNKNLSIKIDAENADECYISSMVEDACGNILLSSKQPYKNKLEFFVEDAKLWTLENPDLYYLVLNISKDDKIYDEKRIRFGFRSVDFKSDGFYLNGKKLLIRGLNRHQSWPYIGYAAPKRMQRLDADILKYELGVNAVRTSHYPQSHDFIDRCDELGLLVFTEIPGWQYIGDEEWKKQAMENTREMVMQYRNHPSIFIWGVRINESPDDDEFYRETNEIAHSLDPTRPTGGVRFIKKSSLLEDVYTYNDFYHNGLNEGCEPKTKVTSDMSKGYLVTEYNGHMFPTKSFDWEEKRREHAIRHARVLDAVAKQEDIGGSFGWAMFDYNTHSDFGSGDRICYHGVMDAFRNPKLAAAVYKSQDPKQAVLEISSSMDIGEHPIGYLGDIYAFTNVDEIKLYKNDEFIRSFTADRTKSRLKYPPIKIDDTIGELLVRNENMSEKTAKQVKKVLFAVAEHGQNALPKNIYPTILKLMLFNKMTFRKAELLYGKYIASWGEKSTAWRFDGYRDQELVLSCKKEVVRKLHLEVRVDSRDLIEGDTYDVATVRIRVLDQNNNPAYYLKRVLKLEIEGDAELIGPDNIDLMGGMAATYVKTLGREGSAKLRLKVSGLEEKEIDFNIRKDK